MDVDRELIAGARTGGADLERLIVAVWPEAYRIAFGILRDRGLAEDAAQEAAAAIARSLHALNDPNRFQSWCYRIAANEALSAARRQPRTRSLDAVSEPGVSFDRSDALDLYAALRTLPLVQRAAIVLHYYAGLDSGEAARAMGMPRSTVRFHLMLARRRLRKALAPLEPTAESSSQGALSNVQ
jgi:RNA polymerase sigma factor (sigma-70 family)